MAKNLHEILNSLKNEDNADLIAEATKVADAQHKGNTQLYSRAKKAEGFEQKNGEWVKVEKPKPPVKKDDKPDANKSDEPNYALDAFLEGRDIKHSDDKKLVKDEMARLKLPAGDIIGMKHIKSQLKDAKDQREAKSGAPTGDGKSGGTGQHDVDYWIDQKNKDGTFKTPKDPELATKVIDARIKKETNSSKYDDGDLYSG